MKIKCAKCSTWGAPVYHESISAVRECQLGNRSIATMERPRDMGGGGGGALETPGHLVSQAPAKAWDRPVVSEPRQAGKSARYHTAVPEGRYAVKLDPTDKLRFFKVDCPTTGRWNGYTFIKEQASDDLYAVRDRGRREQILESIARNPEEAMLTYGRELGKCGHCGRTLTDEASRARGIGPVCAQKISW